MQATIKAAQPEVGTQSGNVFDLKGIAVEVPEGIISKKDRGKIGATYSPDDEDIESLEMRYEYLRTKHEDWTLGDDELM